MSKKTIVLYTFILFLAGSMGAKDLNFTFGNPSYPPPPGYSKITAGLIYSKSNGYGWLRQCARNGGPYKEAKSEETKTSCGCLPDEKTAPLRIDLPDGVYMVKAYLGHVTPTEGRKVCMAINGKTVIAPPGAGGWGTVATPSVPAVVENGKMDIVFYTAKDGRIEVFALEIKEIKDKANAEKMKQRFVELPDYTENTEAVAKASELFSISGKKLVEVARRQETAPGPWIEKYKSQKALIFTRSNQGAILDYSIPRKNEIITVIGTFTARGEKASAYMGVYANEDLKDTCVSISDLRNGNSVIPADSITIFK
ncbi:MAG: hypothetical protein PHT27_08305, partial [Candidatus Izemoplasmatales bacterium]|nr:hypothetical protein [Candidatus Izemoplasmatales bacterium]